MGTPAVLKLSENVQTLKASKATFRRATGGVVQLDLRNVLMLSVRSERHCLSLRFCCRSARD